MRAHCNMKHRLSNRRRFIKAGALFVPAAFNILVPKAQVVLPGSIMRTIAGSGAGPNTFSDDFSGTGALSANWTVAAGSADRLSDEYRVRTGGFANQISVYTGTSTGSLTQYVRISLNVVINFPWFILRYTDASSPFYAIQFEGSTATFTWYKFPNAAGSGTQIGASIDLGGDMTGETVGITITGTGANTDIRVWRGITGLPSAADNWNGDTTPDGTWLTTDPGGDAVDTGQIVGIGAQTSTADTILLDDFFGGGL